MGKKKGKKTDDYWENDFEEDAELVQAVPDTSAPVAVAPVSAVDAMDDDGEGLMAQMKKTQQKKNKKQQDLKDQEDEERAKEESRIKSKKEKERERKERQKQSNKKQTTKPVSDTPATPPPDSIEPKDDSTEDSKPSTNSSVATDAKKKKKKAGPPISALREFLAAKQAAEEENRKLQEEAERAEEERLKKIEEEENQKAEERRLKKEREKARKEQLRKEGKLISDSERKKRQVAQMKLEAMRAAGMIVPALDRADTTNPGEKKKKIVYDNRKKKNQKKDIIKSDVVETKEENTEATEPLANEEIPIGSEDVHESDGQESENENIVLDELEEQDGVLVEEESEPAESWEEVAESWEEVEEVAIDEKHKNAEIQKPKRKPHSQQNDARVTETTKINEDVKHAKGLESKSVAEVPSELALKESQKRDNKPEKAKTNVRSKENLRSPICVILGHVDTGKTKLLDKIRQTNVQEGEAGGITQQIGATYFPTESISQKTEVVRVSKHYGNISEKTGFNQNFEIKVPGLLVIDTPGHESFTNLRSRGSSLCNIAILVVDIMHGLEPQTIESINLLKARKTPFIVALNKIDRIYGWDNTPNNAFLDSFAKQSDSVKKEFEQRLDKAKLAFAEQGLNAELYYKNKDVRKYVSVVPTSAITGEGIPDLLSLLIQLTQNRLTDTLMYLSKLEATVLEVKVVEGHGTTIDVILSNGVLHEGDRIVICGLNGPIVTNIRALLTPQPMRELRVKSAYVHHKEIKAAMGVKISAPDLDKAIAGSRLLVVGPEDDEEEMREDVMADLTDLFENVDKSGRGVCVQASTLGSLEALLSFLKDSKIPVAGINIGPVYKKDVLRASVMLEHAKEYATILAFDVKIDKEAQEYADEAGVRIFKADIIYHLFDWFTAYMNDIKEKRRQELAPKAIWPCWLKIVPGCIFNKKDPIILGVDVLEGSVRIGTPLCIPSKGGILLGRVAGIEANHKSVEIAKKGQQIAVRIESPPNEPPKIAGRHFMETDEVVSLISRVSIDVLKETFRDEVSKEEWLLVKKLKPLLHIN